MNKTNETINEGQDLRMEKVIVNYLEMETSYALLINGRRGIGKTVLLRTGLYQKLGK